MNFKNYSSEISKEQQLKLYRELLLPRMIEEKMLSLLRQGKISKWFSGIGQEAISVGFTNALNSGDYLLPMHRNLGVFTSRNIPLHRLFRQWQGKEEGFTNGRDRSFHFGTKEYNIIGMISHLGATMSVADGIALASKLSNSQKIAVSFTGDGGTSEGDFHEALNVAAVWDLPVIFVIENNGYGLSTPISEQYKCEDLVDRAIGYGIEGVQIDGNNILEVYTKALELSEIARTEQRPILVEAKTFRMRGHEEASGTKYVPQELFDEWEKKDPIKKYEEHLISEFLITPDEIAEQRAVFKTLINDEWKIADNTPNLEADFEKEISSVYAVSTIEKLEPSSEKSNMRMVDAISNALEQEMEHNPKLILMGQDIAEYGGVFKITEGFTEKFGTDRVRNTPLCESAIVGTALGLSLEGYDSMMEMQFSDFVSCGFNQIVNHLAKTHYRWGHSANITIRMPSGAGVGAGPFHSQTTEAWFTKVPGLKVVFPATPSDAKGLLISSLNDPNPVLFFEHKLLYRSISEEVPTHYYNIELGKAAIAQEGKDLTIITYGIGVHWAKNAVEQLKSEADIEIIDLRTLIPLDEKTIFESVKKTGKVLILHEDTQTSGFGGEIVALIAENLFEHLDAPIMRVTSLDTPVPFNSELEKQFLANYRLIEKLKTLIAY